MSQVEIPLPPRRHGIFLYRLWASTTTLIYLGITTRLYQRLIEHYERKTWAAEITRITIEQFPTWDEAVTAEVMALASEAPRENKRGLPSNQFIDRALLIVPRIHPKRRQQINAEARRALQ